MLKFSNALLAGTSSFTSSLGIKAFARKGRAREKGERGKGREGGSDGWRENFREGDIFFLLVRARLKE